jgi:CO/xanthine dehydrogenase FAD-binding subunit
VRRRRRPTRALVTEQLLSGAEASQHLIATAAWEAADGLEPSADIHGSAEYRVGLVREYVKRVLILALGRARVEL